MNQLLIRIKPVIQEIISILKSVNYIVMSAINKTTRNLLAFCMLMSAISAFGQEPINDSPINNLPSYVKLVSGFGERPDWSHDGRFILFLDKPMGEVFELELATGIIRPKTRHFNHYGFTRAMYLSN